jgi:hypothetical protein
MRTPRNDNDNELISFKTSRNTVRYNYFEDNSGRVTIRHGAYNEVYGNIIICADSGLCNGVRSQGNYAKIYNNYIYNPVSFGINVSDGDDSECYLGGTVTGISGDVITDTNSPGWPTNQWQTDGELKAGLFFIDGNRQGIGYGVTSNTANTLTVDGADWASAPAVQIGDEYYLSALGSTQCPADNNLVANNTCIETISNGDPCYQYGDGARDHDPTGGVFRNNIAYSTVTLGLTNPLFDDNAAGDDGVWNTNIVYATGGQPLTSGDAVATNINPNLAAGTPMRGTVGGNTVDTGTVDTANFLDDIDGQLRGEGAWDIGADEYSDPVASIETISVGCSFAGCGGHTIAMRVAGNGEPVVSPTITGVYVGTTIQ